MLCTKNQRELLENSLMPEIGNRRKKVAVIANGEVNSNHLLNVLLKNDETGKSQISVRDYRTLRNVKKLQNVPETQKHRIII